MNTNLGQSKFQDTYFVAGAQLTPFRQLRQIELELRSIHDALKRGSISKRRTELKISKLDPSDPEEALDIEEALWDLEQQTQMVQDAEARRANFEQMKADLLAQTPQEYWAIGYEAAEQDHWVKYFSNQLALMHITQQPNIQTMQQILLMPEEAQRQIALNSRDQIIQISTQNAPKVISNS